MDNIILYLLTIIQQQYKTICRLLNLICRYLPHKQWAFDDSRSPEYKKYSIDRLPRIGSPKQDWDWNDLLAYYKKRYGKELMPVRRRSHCDIPETSTCPRCGAPLPYLYKNNGSKGLLLCKVCDNHFAPDNSRHHKTFTLRCSGHQAIRR